MLAGKEVGTEGPDYRTVHFAFSMDFVEAFSVIVNSNNQLEGSRQYKLPMDYRGGTGN